MHGVLHYRTPPLPSTRVRERDPTCNGFDREAKDDTYESQCSPMMDTIEFTITLSGGFGEGVNQSQESALARPFRPLREEGKPVGKVNFLFTDPLGFPSSVVGSLCFSPGNRLLFYPALESRNISWYTRGDGPKEIGPEGSIIDHLTLEPGFERWHLTLLDPGGKKVRKLPTKRTSQVGGSAFYWFGLSISGTNALERSPEKLILQFPAPMTDSERRMGEFQEASEGAKWHLLHLPENETLQEGHFLHFDFIVDPTSSIDVAELPSFAPAGPPALESAVDRPTQFRLRSHPVGVPDFPATVEVVVSQRPGRLVDQAILIDLA